MSNKKTKKSETEILKEQVKELEKNLSIKTSILRELVYQIKKLETEVAVAESDYIFSEDETRRREWFDNVKFNVGSKEEGLLKEQVEELQEWCIKNCYIRKELEYEITKLEKEVEDSLWDLPFLHYELDLSRKMFIDLLISVFHSIRVIIICLVNLFAIITLLLFIPFGIFYFSLSLYFFILSLIQ